MNKFVIYLLRNIINGKIYVGQTNNLRRRIKEYSIRKITKKSQKYELMYEIIAHGIENFSFSILEECENRKELNEKEIKWINTLNSCNPDIGYNKKTGGEGGLLNVESKIKMSISSKLFRHTELTKLKKSIPIISVKDNKFIKWQSSKVFADFIDTNRTNVTHAVKTGSTVRGYYIFYFEKEKRDSISNSKEPYNSIKKTLEEGVEIIEPYIII